MREEAGKDIQLSQKQVSQTLYNLQLPIVLIFNLELDTQNQHGVKRKKFQFQRKASTVCVT